MSRTLETPSAVSSGAFSPFGRRSPVVDFPRHPHASTCSSCPTTARRASCATSCATLSVWTRALSSPNSAASGQSAPKSCDQLHKASRGLSYLDWSLSHLRSSVEQKGVMKELYSLLFLFLSCEKLHELWWSELFCISLSPIKGDTATAAQSIFNISLCLSIKWICDVFNSIKYRHNVARSLFLRLNRLVLGSNATILSELESNTDAM